MSILLNSNNRNSYKNSRSFDNDFLLNSVQRESLENGVLKLISSFFFLYK